jgi:hypothetical protein
MRVHVEEIVQAAVDTYNRARADAGDSYAELYYETAVPKLRELIERGDRLGFVMDGPCIANLADFMTAEMDGRHRIDGAAVLLDMALSAAIEREPFEA